MKKLMIGLAMLLYALTPAWTAAETTDGRVAELQGQAEAVRNGVTRILALNDPVLAGDAVRTGSNATLRIEMRDGTQIILSQNTDLHIANFQYTDGGTGGEAELGFFKGLLRVVTGKLNKQANARFNVSTRTAVMGLRGTDVFFEFKEDNSLLVVMNDGEEVRITSRTGEVLIVRDGWGVLISHDEQIGIPFPVDAATLNQLKNNAPFTVQVSTEEDSETGARSVQTQIQLGNTAFQGASGGISVSPY